MKTDYIEIQPSLVNFYIDFPIYIIHPKEDKLVRFLPRKDEYARKAIDEMVSRGIKVYVRLVDHHHRSEVIEANLAEFLKGPFNQEKAAVIRDLTIQLVNEFFAGRLSKDRDQTVDSSALKRMDEIVGHYVRLLDLENAQDVLKMLQRVMVKDFSTTAHSVNLMLLVIRFRGRERERLYPVRAVPDEMVSNRGQIREEIHWEDRRWALAALLHDIGKIYVPDEIVKSRRKLTPREFKLMQQHVEFGWEFVRSAGLRYGYNDVVRSAILEHHERLDGSGYPLKLTNVGTVGQVMGILDAYETLTTPNRPHNKGSTPFEALIALKKDTQEGKFDSVLFKKIVELLAQD